ncbi:hypothetical protein [Shinella fusca]|jgi:hypothetical protein|uniref:Uncharacterized protein n=1 Tax=Shinella fusca TaxID=544480 RepID=A0A7W7YT52_9HYPH|nr:hypothetical protein [Shinella fusca]MBB5041774.1 hypothetical protein [Shinella fusca]
MFRLHFGSTAPVSKRFGVFSRKVAAIPAPFGKLPAGVIAAWQNRQQCLKIVQQHDLLER